MSRAAVRTFEESIAGLPATLEQVRAAEFESALAPHLEEPAVGVELPYEDVSLADLPVDLSPAPTDIAAAATGVTPAELAIGDYGSVVLGDRNDAVEPVSLYADTHVAVVRSSDVVESMAEAVDSIGERIRAGMGSAVIATGPSATADMGGLVHGVHGPRAVHVLVLSDR